MNSRWRLAAPFLVAAAIVYIVDLDALALGAALGVAGFVALLLAGRPVPLRLGALALGGAFSLGLSAAIFSALLGQPVLEMVATGSSAVGVLLGVGAVLLGAFGLLCVLWAALAGRRE
jgi:hypothetical protein